MRSYLEAYPTRSETPNLNPPPSQAKRPILPTSLDFKVRKDSLKERFAWYRQPHPIRDTIRVPINTPFFGKQLQIQ